MTSELRGLSPSSLQLFLSCNRKYFYKKIEESLPDEDFDSDVESLQIGKCFHKVLEDNRHELAGISYDEVLKVASAFFSDSETYAPMLFVMLRKYKVIHEKAGLHARACEIEISTVKFRGFIDVILIDEKGDWWIGDMKTARAFQSNLIPQLSRHPQLNLYAAHAAYISNLLGLELNQFKGCRYRLTTKSALIRKSRESTPDFIQRLSKAIKSYDFIIPKSEMVFTEMMDLHESVKSYIESNLERPEAFPQNFGSCLQYYRPCEFFSKCHGKLFSSDRFEIEMIDSGDE